MKAMKRRLLSLFMAMVMVCSLVPIALATDPDLSVVITPPSSIVAGTAATFSLGALSGPDADGYTAGTPTWSATPKQGTSGSATVSGNNITFSASGSYTVSVSGTAIKPNATDKSYGVTVDVNVDAPQLSSITVTPSSRELTVGETVSLSAAPVPAAADLGTVSWSSGSDSIATVNPTSGVVTAVGVGNTTITASSGSARGTCSITVKPQKVDASIALTANSVEVGKKVSAIFSVPDSVPANATIKWTQSGGGKVSISGDTTNNPEFTGVTKGTVILKVTYTSGGNVVAEQTATLTVTQPEFYITTNASNDTLTSWGDTCKATATGADSSKYFVWSTDKSSIVDVSSGHTNTATLTAGDTGTATITVKVYEDSSSNTPLNTAQITVRVSYKYDINPVVTVNENNSAYNLEDQDDKGDDSVVEQIEDLLGNSADRYTYIVFKGVTDSAGDLTAELKTDYYLDSIPSSAGRYSGLLRDIEFIPERTGTATFEFTVYLDNNKTRSGLLTVKVEEGNAASGDITYTAELGEDYYFDVGDFEDFWEDKYPNGTLDHVVFETASGGNVKGYRSTVDYKKDKYYVDPGKNDLDLADTYFSPSSSKKAMTAKVTFTAYGSKTGSSGSSYDRAGTITIVYLNDSASDITYSTTNGKVSLDPKDFEDAYKEATGSKTAPSNLTIEFQNVPANGTLTYTGGSKDKDLTKSNVKSTRYTTKSSGSNRLAQLTYSGTKGKDTIDYIAYSGGTAQFSGKVVFNGAPAVPTDVVVGPFYSTAGQPAAFSQNTFTAASSAISNAVKVRFVAPANGTLTMSGASAAGTDIAVSLLNLVTYQPKAGYNGTDQIIFAAYDAKNAVVASGTVNVQVIGNPTTTTPTTPGGSTGGVTDVSQFKDVSSGAWYRDNLATLVKKGVISGRGDGKFDPKGTVTYGEALKMVLEACGYTAAVGTGSQWAINYKNLAVSRGWISNDIDLNAAISRNATAELAAKVLGVSPVTSGSPFADDANAYAVALYYTTPQIFVGTTNPNGGKPLFENNKALLREQVCAVICRVMDYHTQHTTNTMPDGT